MPDDKERDVRNLEQRTVLLESNVVIIRSLEQRIAAIGALEQRTALLENHIAVISERLTNQIHALKDVRLDVANVKSNVDSIQSKTTRWEGGGWTLLVIAGAIGALLAWIADRLGLGTVRP